MIGPVDGSVPLTCVIVIGSPFGSVSFANRFAVAICPVIAEARSSPAAGLLFSDGFESAMTFKVTMASSVAPLGSTTVYSNMSSPIKPAGGT